MIAKPPIDDMVKLVGNKYALCCAIAKRAKELNEMQKKREISTDIKPISFASKELYEGETKLVK